MFLGVLFLFSVVDVFGEHQNRGEQKTCQCKKCCLCTEVINHYIHFPIVGTFLVLYVGKHSIKTAKLSFIIVNPLVKYNLKRSTKRSKNMSFPG